MASEQTLKKL